MAAELKSDQQQVEREVEVSFPVTGMTCASCVRRIERALGKLDGVESATVNLATEKATVHYVPDLVGREDFKRAVEKAGYALGEDEPTAQEPGSGVADREAEERRREVRDLKIRFSLSLAAGAAIMGLMFMPLPVAHTSLFLPMLLLATPVQFWAGWGF